MLDVLVVGSGYGGSVVAARLAPHGRVLVVERGRAWPSGQLPHSLLDLGRAYRTGRRPLGLWEARLGAGVGNAVASGLGGGSLLNYGITARPDDHTFDEWPVPAARMAPSYERALSVLRPEPAPFAATLADRAFIDRVEPGRRVDLVNTIDWERCICCGRCVPGCNHDAKRTLEHTYLALALRGGAEVRTGTEVLSYAQRPGGWDVTLAATEDRRRTEVVSARVLVLAAGVFGTLDLLEAQRGALPLSPMLGRRMSMNGDALAFLYNTSYPQSGEHGAPITTTARLTVQDPAGRPRTLTIMAGRLPASVRGGVASLLALAGGSLGSLRGPEEPRWDRVRRRLADLTGASAGGAVAHTFMFKLDGQDQYRGQARFEDGRSTMDWPDYVDDPILRFAADRLRLWADKVGGRPIRDLGTWPGMRSFGVHPLGGARMGRGVEDGVVDDRCRVHRPAGGVWPGLYVVDGSAVPTSLGVPPSLTIAAVAERASEAIVADVRGAKEAA